MNKRFASLTILLLAVLILSGCAGYYGGYGYYGDGYSRGYRYSPYGEGYPHRYDRHDHRYWDGHRR
ncbi:MAG TPA: hypothetical protein VLK23_21360 [Thermodesulfobacteriota bacterium]|nr:hypothetical protein [Thermodesulfobacteriota bacterium]